MVELTREWRLNPFKSPKTDSETAPPRLAWRAGDSACVAKGLNPRRDRFAVFVAHRRAGARYSYFVHHMRGAHRKHKDAIGEGDRLVNVVGDEHGDHAAAFDEPRQVALQLPGERRVE